jgi:hypothetical protein
MLLTLDLLDTWRRPVTAEVMIRRETVELRCLEIALCVGDVVSAHVLTPYVIEDLRSRL